MKEIARVLAREREDSELCEVRHHASRRGPGNLAGSVAEVADHAVLDRRAARGEEREERIVH